MVRDIIHDEFFLRQTSAPATRDDLPAAQDLRDTLAAHRGECVGLAANMIGVLRRIIAVEWEGGCLLMLNPEILRASGVYQTEEGCLSLTGTRQTKRYDTPRVRQPAANRARSGIRRAFRHPNRIRKSRRANRITPSRPENRPRKKPPEPEVRENS